MTSPDTKKLVEKAVLDFQKLVPALAGLKLVCELELRGRGDVQLFRVELPGDGPPKITKDCGGRIVSMNTSADWPPGSTR